MRPVRNIRHWGTAHGADLNIRESALRNCQAWAFRRSYPRECRRPIHKTFNALNL